ncbi:hypothetical protein GOP47_0001535 [Adiantum capillus-veneris]|uniref:Exonuclease domain-containing protein n=1 Tax=Adiantum capillus-veneris TaxID=13818 RepID=A0A9D4VA90_ADICA|nr:hypothetical protein GOP47_0001535 [Adiantum capillus-veneris]
MVATQGHSRWDQCYLQLSDADDRRAGKEVILEGDDEESDFASMRRDMRLEEGERKRRKLQIAFFDLETTVASGAGDKPKLLEFGAVVLAAQGLRELQAYSTLVRQPGVFSMGPKFNLSQHRIVDLPSFDDIADQVFDMLHGRIWAGHNIIKFDMVCIRDAFATARRRPPQPAGVIDTLPLLRETFGPRAGDLKMASLAKYCGLGKQKHRSLADVRMNVEVLKHCATILFLESRFPSVLMLQKQLYTRSASRSIEGGILPIPPTTNKWTARWTQVMQRPKFRAGIEMKRTSFPRAFAPSTSGSPPLVMKRQAQVYFPPRLGPT